MTTQMPEELDSFTDPTAGTLLSGPSGQPHSFQHDRANDAIFEMEKMLVGPVFLNVKGYGAVGDGTHDDTTAIQATINAAAVAAFGGVVYLPPGIYLISASLTIPSGVWVIGSGKVTSRIQTTTGIASPAVVCSGLGLPSGLRDVEVNRSAGGSVVSSQVGVQVVNANGVGLSDVWINGFYSGIKWSGSGDCWATNVEVELCSNQGYWVTDSEAIRLRGCDSYRNGYGYMFDTKRAFHNGTTQHQAECEMTGCSDIESVSQALVIDNFVNLVVNGFSSSCAGPTSTNATETAVWIKGGSVGITLNGPVVKHPKVVGIQVSGACDAVTINNPQVEGVGYFSTVPVQTLYGVFVTNDCTNCNMTGGITKNSEGNGVYWGANGGVSNHIVHNFAINNSGTQGLVGVEVAMGVGDPTKYFSGTGIHVRNEGGARGTGFLMTTASSGFILLSLCTHVNVTTAFTNNTGGTVRTRAISWAADTA